MSRAPSLSPDALARPLDQPPAAASAAVRVEPVTAATLPAFRTAVVEGFLQPDDTGVVLDHFTRDVTCPSAVRITTGHDRSRTTTGQTTCRAPKY
jgi:hypothetical protein